MADEFKTHILEMSDQHKIFCYKWAPGILKSTKGIVLILHGMAEHARRYQLFAHSLTKEGYLVFAYDQRGHGQTGTQSKSLGFFGPENGWARLVKDVDEVIAEIRTHNGIKPLFLLGHSMGSFVAQSYAGLFGEKLSGLVLSGTSWEPALSLAAGKTVAKLFSKFFGKQSKGSFLQNIIFGGYNSKIKHAKTDFDWLSCDPQTVKMYIADHLCGFTCTNQFFVDLFSGIRHATSKSNISNIPGSLPVLFFSGLEDPLNRKGSSINKMANIYQNAGVQTVDIKLYPGKRHETLNEIGREEIFQDIISWLNTHCTSV